MQGRFKFQKKHNNQPRRPSRAGYSMNRRIFPRNAKSNAGVLKAILAVQLAEKSKEIENETVYIPQYRFGDFPISDLLKKNINDKNYLSPLPIQDKCIPEILKGQDVIGIANTGTDKTAAFLIPLVDKIYNDRTQKVIIITPTRELATQINDELRSFAKGMNIGSAICIGGVNIDRQKNDIRRNPNFVIGTPGRIRDLIHERSLFLSQFNNIVLDEADRMVDIGFINDIKFFISLLSPNRQSLFFSATVSGKVQEIIKGFVRNPVTISSVVQKDSRDNIDQNLIKVESRETKTDQLHDLLIQEGFDKVLIFGRTKHGIQKLTDELIRRGFKAGVIHGNKRQSQRQKVLEQFKRNEINILLATDIASRGLDITGISHVINYDIPATFEDYIHRIGRTGRVNNKGSAITFIE